MGEISHTWRDFSFRERFGRDFTHLERFLIRERFGRDFSYRERFHNLGEIWERFSIKRDKVKTIERGFVCDIYECLASQHKVCKPC